MKQKKYIHIEKLCLGCKSTVPITGFYKNKSKYDGLDGLCKVCRTHLNKCRAKQSPKRPTIKQRLREGYKITLAYWRAQLIRHKVCPSNLIANTQRCHFCEKPAICWSFDSYKSMWRTPSGIYKVVKPVCAKHNKEFLAKRNKKLHEVLD
jgi:hypothetical protein